MSSRHPINVPDVPRAIEAEQATLGSCLLSRPAIEKAQTLVVPEDFDIRAHRILCTLIFEAHSRGELADWATLSGPLQQRTNLSAEEARHLFVNLVEAGCPSEVEHYCQKVKNAADRRRLLQVMQDAVRITRDSSTFEAAFDQVESLLGAFHECRAQSRGPATILAPTLMQMEFTPTRMVVPGIIPAGLTLLVSKPKIGKSWFAYQLGIAVASGGKALGTIDVEQGEVLLLMLEDTKRRAKLRIGQLLNDCPAPERLHIATEWARMDDGGRASLIAFLRQHPEVRLVVIDTLEKFRARRSDRGNAYAEDYQALGDIKAIADRFDVAILVIHHERKMKGDDMSDSVSGSAGVTGAADGMLLIRRERGRKDAVLTVTGRDVEEAEYGLQFDQLTAWTLMGDAEQFRHSREDEEVLAVLRRHQRSLRPNEMAAELSIPAGTLRSRLFRMKERGLVLEEDSFYSIHPRLLEKPPVRETPETVQRCNGATLPVAPVAGVSAVAPVAPVAPNPQNEPPQVVEPLDLPDEATIPEERRGLFDLAQLNGWPLVELGGSTEVEATEAAWRYFCAHAFPEWIERARDAIRRLYLRKSA